MADVKELRACTCGACKSLWEATIAIPRHVLDVGRRELGDALFERGPAASLVLRAGLVWRGVEEEVTCCLPKQRSLSEELARHGYLCKLMRGEAQARLPTLTVQLDRL